MGFFDFLKKKELNRIKELENIIDIQNQKINSLSKYENLTDIHSEIEKLKSQKLDLEIGIQKLKNDYQKDLKIYLELKKATDVFRDDIEMADFGVYYPHFSFDTSEEYKAKILALREEQKRLIKNKKAVYGGENISWNGSLSQGQAIVNSEKKLMMRAFNGESDSFIANVDWNNITRMEERIKMSYNAINKVFDKQGIKIGDNYKNLKIDELRLTYEYHKKKQEEREEQRAIREQMREEEKVQREIENARIQAEKEEQIYLKALEKARKDIGTAVGEKHEELLKRIAELEAGLIGVETLKQKALSMAQQTKMGYVYVISNIGSFGEDIYKIGMTRRLEPVDRVMELGSASVPFPFDIHAMIFSENAPELENKLHNAFSENRLNMINYRKEFFNIPLEKIKEEAERLGAKVEFTMVAEAEQYRETKIIKDKKEKTSIAETPFPMQI